MKRQSRWALAGLLLYTFSTAGLGAQQDAGDPAPPELLDGLARFFESVLDDDVAGIDEATCLGDLLHARLRREAALGLVADAADPVLVEERRSAARSAVVAFVERLFDEGQTIESVDASRLELFAAGSEEGERLIGEGAGELEITASGVVGIKMTGLPREVDLSVYRLGERWCLDPLSIP